MEGVGETGRKRGAEAIIEAEIPAGRVMPQNWQSLNDAADIAFKTSRMFVTTTAVLLCNVRHVNAAFPA